MVLKITKINKVWLDCRWTTSYFHTPVWSVMWSDTPLCGQSCDQTHPCVVSHVIRHTPVWSTCNKKQEASCNCQHIYWLVSLSLVLCMIVTTHEMKTMSKWCIQYSNVITVNTLINLYMSNQESKTMDPWSKLKKKTSNQNVEHNKTIFR